MKRQEGEKLVRDLRKKGLIDPKDADNLTKKIEEKLKEDIKKENSRIDNLIEKIDFTSLSYRAASAQYPPTFG